MASKPATKPPKPDAMALIVEDIKDALALRKLMRSAPDVWYKDGKTYHFLQRSGKAFTAKELGCAKHNKCRCNNSCGLGLGIPSL